MIIHDYFLIILCLFVGILIFAIFVVSLSEKSQISNDETGDESAESNFGNFEECNSEYNKLQATDCSFFSLGDVQFDPLQLAQNVQRHFQKEKIDALGKFAAGISHDFNNVLAIVYGFSKIAQTTDDPSHYFQKIESATERGSNLTKKLQSFSKKRIVEKNTYDLTLLLKQEKAILEKRLPANITLMLSIQDQTCAVECADDCLSQILTALTDNAADSMPNGGNIFIRLERTPKYLPGNMCNQISDFDPRQQYYALSIRDSGTGIEPEHLPHIYDPFFTTDMQGQRTGLGLSVVYGLIQETKGGIDIKSIPGHGTEVILYFPASDKAVKSVSGDVINPKSLRFDGVTALVVDDEPDIAEMLKDLLTQQGASVIVAENGNEALIRQVDHDKPVDVLLTDILMPEMNGVELAELFHAVNPKADIIYMSGYPAGGTLADLRLPEDATFLAKPVDYDALLKILFYKLTGGEGVSSMEGQQAQWETNLIWEKGAEDQKRHVSD